VPGDVPHHLRDEGMHDYLVLDVDHGRISSCGRLEPEGVTARVTS
jgi:hypothetical protein